MKQLPKTEDDFEASNSQIKEALYQLGVIYKDKLNEIKLSNNNFVEIFTRFPSDEKYSSLALYKLYTNYLEKDSLNAEKTKEKLLEKYPNSIYAKTILDPQYTSEELDKKNKLEQNYQEVFMLYKKNAFDEILEKTEEVLQDKYKNKLLLLRAFSFLQKKDVDNAVSVLQNVSEEDSITHKEAKYILDAINNPAKIEKANELAVTKSAYLYRPSHQHMLVLLLPKSGVDVTYLKTLISDFHINSIGNEVFEISALLLGVDQHLLMIKFFENSKESMEYYNLFVEESTIMSVVNKSPY